jgi:tubulin polyglutamylase TTLL6/13
MRAHPRTLHPVQRVNHFPNMKQLYLKNCLAENMAAVFAEISPGLQCPISPRSWCVPSQLAQLAAHLRPPARRGGLRGTADAEGSAVAPTVYIVKPAGGLQGHGIHLTIDPLSNDGVRSGKPYVVQEYVDPPLLLDGFKFDLRLYVLVLSVDPLNVHLFNDGLVRLCTTPYTKPDTRKSMGNRNAHLTNYSLNKKSKNFVKGPDGSKRALKDVFATLKATGIDVDRLWASTIDVINKSILATHPKLLSAYRAVVPKGSTLHLPSSTCYELLGFDVMYDEDLKPWLIEVNHAPSFRGGSKVDGRIKAGVIQQTLQMLHVSEKRKRLLLGRCRKEWEKYMFDQAGCKPPSPARPKRSSVGGKGGRRRPASAHPLTTVTVRGGSERASDPDLAALMDMCSDGESCVSEDVGEEEAVEREAADREIADMVAEADGAGAGGPPSEGGGSSSDDDCADNVSEVGTDDGSVTSSAVDLDSEGDEPSDDERGDVPGYSAPLPGTPDEFIQVYSGLSKRHRATYAPITAAATAAYAKETERRDAERRDAARTRTPITIPHSADSRRHSEPTGRMWRPVSSVSSTPP